MSKQPAVFVSTQPDEEDIPKILENVVAHVQREMTANADLVHGLTVVVGCDYSHTVVDDNLLSFPSVMSLLVWLYRKFGVHRNEREIVINEEDQLVVLQLCLAEVNKQTTGDFDVDMSDVLVAHKALISQKLGNPGGDSGNHDVLDLYEQFLSNSNMVDFMTVISKLREELVNNEELQKLLNNAVFLWLYSPSGDIEKQAFQLLCEDRQILKTALEIPLVGSGACGITTTACSYDDILRFSVANGVKSKFSPTESYLEQVFISYMQLLVNSRSELALARVLNFPDRELNHRAFTALKRVAKTKNMPMFQTASSYILRIRLGGKGYAPGHDSPINPYVKGFGEFVDFIHRLQTLVEEEVDPRKAIEKVIGVIRKLILQCRTNTLRGSSVETIVTHLKELLPECITFHNTGYGESPEKPDSNGGSVLGKKTTRILRQIIDRKVTQPMTMKCTDVLSDVVTSQKTPVRLPSIFSHFKSPEVLECSPEAVLNKSLAERVLNAVAKPEKKQAIQRYQAGYDWMQADRVVPNAEDVMFFKAQQEALNSVETCVVTPAKTFETSNKARKILESINDQENIQVTVAPAMNASAAGDCGKKRPLQAKRGLDCTDNKQPAAKKQKVAAKSAGRKTSKKTLKPLPKGQQQLTKFFR